MQSEDTFSFDINDVVLVDWERKLYYAKILSINHTKSRCRILFDDGSCGNAHFSQIHNVNETTADIHCVVCKEDSTSPGNEIVLCDSCSVGYHQRCHSPRIPADALEYFSPWICSYCNKEESNPHIEKNPFEEKQESRKQDNEICRVRQNSLKRAKAAHQGQESNCEASVTDSEMAMKEGYRNHAQKFRRDFGDKYIDGRKYDRDNGYSRNGEKRNSDMRSNAKRIHATADRRSLENSSYHRRRPIASPPESGSESRKENWRRRNRYENDFDRSWKNKSSSSDPYCGMKPGGKRSSHEGKCNGKELARNSSRGPKHQRGRLRDKLAKRYIPNQYLFGFSNKNHTRTFVADKHNTTNNGKEIKENIYKQKRPRDSRDRKNSIDKSNGIVVFNGKAQCSSKFPNPSEVHTKKVRLDGERQNKKRENDTQFDNEHENKAEEDTVNGVSENRTELKDDSDTMSQSAVGGSEFEISRKPLVSETMKAITVESPKGDDKEIERKSRLLEYQNVENRLEEERSAFKYVKECLFLRPGSSIKHQQELLVNYKNTITFCHDKVSQCKHSDAAELEVECASSTLKEKCDNLDGAMSASIMRSVGCETSTLNTPSFSNIDKVKKEDSTSISENATVQKFLTKCSIANGENSEAKLVTTDALVQSFTVEDKVVKAGRKAIDKFICVPTDSKREAVPMDVSDIESIDGGGAIGKATNGKAHCSEGAASTVEMSRGITRSPDTKSPLLGNEQNAAILSISSSCTNLSKSTSLNSGVQSEGPLFPTLEKFSSDCLDVEKSEDEKCEGSSDSIFTDDLSGYVMEKEATLSKVGIECLQSTKSESKASGSEMFGGESEQNFSTNDISNALAISKNCYQNRSLKTVSNVRCEMEIGKKRDRPSTVTYEPGAQIVEPELKSTEPEPEGKEVEKGAAHACDMDAKSSVNDASQQNSSGNVLGKSKECYAAGLPASSAKDLIVEWADNNGSGSSLGIRISDVFSLKKEHVDREKNGRKCDVIESSDRKDVCNEKKKTERVEKVVNKLGSDQIECERSPGMRDGLVNADLEALKLSEKFNYNSSNARKEALEANEELYEGICHRNEGGNLVKRGLESPELKARKTIAKETTDLDDSQSSLDCRTDQSSKRKRKKRKMRESSGTFDIKQTDRLLLDLPRHNWLIERLLSEKKLDSDIIEEEKPCETSQECEKKPKSSKRKKRSDHNRASESDTMKLPREKLEVEAEMSSSKSTDSNEESSDFAGESLGSVDRLYGSKTEGINLLKDKETGAANSGGTTSIEENTERSTKQLDSKLSTPDDIASKKEIENKCVPESGGTDSVEKYMERRTKELGSVGCNAVVQNMEKLDNSGNSGTFSPTSLKIYTPNGITEEMEIAPKSTSKPSTSSEFAQLCKVGGSDPHGLNSQVLSSSSSKNTETIYKKDLNHLDKRIEDLSEGVLAGTIHVPQNKTVEEDVNRSTARAMAITSDRSESVPEMTELISEDTSRSKDRNEVKSVVQLLCKEQQCVNSGNSLDSSLSIPNRTAIGTCDTTSNGASLEGKQENKSIMLDLSSLPPPVRHDGINVNCVVNNLDTGLLALERSNSKTTKHLERFEGSLREQDLSQQDMQKHSYSVPHIIPITLGYILQDHRRHSNVAEGSKCKQSDSTGGNTRCSFSEHPEVTNARHKAPIMSYISNSSSSNPTSVLQHRNFVQATGNLPHRNANSTQSHEKVLPHDGVLKKPTAVPQQYNIDQPRAVPVALKFEVNDNVADRTSMAAPSNVSQERFTHSEKNGINERSRIKSSLDEKAKIILSIIEDKSISDSTKQELVGYWRSIRNIPSHSGSDRLSGSELNVKSHEASHYTAGMKMSSALRHSVFQDNPGLIASKGRGLNPSPLSTALTKSDSHCQDLPVPLAEQVCSALGRSNVRQHTLTEFYPQRVSPTLSNNERSNFLSSTEVYRDRGFNTAKRPSSDSSFVYKRTEELHRRRVEIPEMADHPRYSPKRSRFMFNHHLYPENNLHRTDSNSYHLNLSTPKVSPGHAVHPDTTLIRSPNYGHLNSDLNAPQGDIPEPRLSRSLANIGDIRDKSPRRENRSNHMPVMDHSRRHSAVTEQDLLLQQRIEHLNRNKLKGRSEDALAHAHQVGQLCLSREGETTRIDAGHKLLRQQQIHQYSDLQQQQNFHQQQQQQQQQQQHHKIISQRLPQWQPDVDNVTLLQAQPTEHLKQPILQKQLQLHHQQNWQQELRQHHFNHQRKLQPPMVRRPQQLEQKYPQKSEELMNTYRLPQGLQRERIIIREEPHEMREHRQQNMARQSVEERKYSLDEKHVGKHPSFGQYQRYKTFQQQQDARHSKKCFEDELALCVDSGRQSHLHVPSQLHSALRPQTTVMHEHSQVSVSPEKTNCKNHSPITYHDPQSRKRDASPCFDVPKQSIRQTAGCTSNGHILAASCESCGNKATLLCSRCRGAMYCSEKCQFKEWQDHRKHCKSNNSGQDVPKTNQWHQMACN